MMVITLLIIMTIRMITIFRNLRTKLFCPALEFHLCDCNRFFMSTGSALCFKSKPRILKPQDGEVKAGHLVALMGPSGSGKLGVFAQDTFPKWLSLLNQKSLERAIESHRSCNRRVQAQVPRTILLR